jgi:outer membrane lipoprotein-sorting protein
MSKKLAFLVLITLVPVGLRAEKSPETGGADPWDLAVNVYEKPTVPYQGRMQVSRFSDKDSKAREVEIYFLPPDLYRMEFYSLKGDIERVVQSDSLREQVTVMSNGKASHVSSYSRPQQTMTPAQQKELLKKNYKSNVTGSDQVMGRPVWVLVLTPVTEGKPVSEYKIDKRTHMVLESKRSLPHC